MAADDQLPFRASALGRPYDRLDTFPVSVVLDSVRSLYNVGAFFRTLDAARASHLYLAGISATPPHARLSKTALGADETVPWSRADDVVALVGGMRVQGITVAAVETRPTAVDLFDWRPSFPVCVVFGHEVEGLRPAVVEACDVAVHVPMLGRKSSLNVATAGGIVVYELLRQYRQQHRSRTSADTSWI